MKKILSAMACAVLTLCVCGGCALFQESASVQGATVDENGALLITLSNGEVIDAGLILGQNGQSGADGKDGSSAYQLYCLAYPEYAGSETDWLTDLANGALKEREGTYGLEYYLLADGTLGVALGTTGYCEEIVVPATHEGFAVTRILDEGFAGDTSLKKMTLPSSITTIGTHAFRCCVNLESLVMPESVVNVGEGAFDYCAKLVITTE